MNKAIYLFLSFLTVNCFSQNDQNINKNFTTTCPISVEMCSIEGSISDSIQFVLDKGYKFKIYSKNIINGKSYYIIKTYNYYYGDDIIIKDFTLDSPYVTTAKIKHTIIENKRKWYYLWLFRDSTTREISKTYRMGSEKVGPLSMKLGDVINFDPTILKTKDSVLVEGFRVSRNVRNKNAIMLSRERVEYNFFAMTEDDFINCSQSYFEEAPRLGVSLLAVPLKVRFNKSIPDFISNINFGGSADLRFRVSHTNDKFIGILTGCSISVIPVNRIEFPKFDTTDSTRNLLALTPHIGFYYKNRQIELVVGTGIDYLTAAKYKCWIYNGKPWIYFGIGASLIQESKASTKDLNLEIKP